jgi:hypothetical protein
MGYALAGVKSSFYWRNIEWTTVLDLAVSHGWKPEGTLPPSLPDLREWDGNYDGNGSQSVTDSDAKAMAEALERAFPYILESSGGGRTDPPTLGRGRMRAWILMLDLSDPLAGMAGAQPKMQAFIGFCREGSFTIT